MGNAMTVGKRKMAKVMTIDGRAFKIKTPVRAGSVIEGYPGHVLMESESVKHYGVRAKPLEPQQELKPRRLYFLVEMPKLPDEKNTRRVRSGIQMTAKDRLESLMLARRSSSDLTILKQPSIAVEEIGGGSGVRLKMRLPKAEVDRLMAESRDGGDVAEKIVNLCRAKSAAANVGDTADWFRDFKSNADRGVARGGVKSREQKRVGFMPISETEIHQLALAS